RGLAFAPTLTYRGDGGFAGAAGGTPRGAESPSSVDPGLFDGRAGMILYLSRGYPAGTAARNGTVAAQLRRLAWHAIDYQGYLAFPGEQLLRLSMDLATGNAGGLLGVGTALHTGPVSTACLTAA